MNPLYQGILTTTAIFIYICYVDKNVPEWLFLVFVRVPALYLARLYWWVRLYPRLQADRFQLLMRMRRKPKDSLSGGSHISDRHLRMAKELMEQINAEQVE